MKAEQLAVEGAWAFTPQKFTDERGFLVSPLQERVFAEARGGPLFPVPQQNVSRSRRGVVRGVHYTAVPPGSAMYLHCPAGEALDIVFDLRVGSPTFGRWDTVVVSPEDLRAVYIPVGVGHTFVALADDTVISYLISESYVAADEKAIQVLDPELGLPIPADVEPILSERDRVAPRLADVAAAGLLPRYEDCVAVERRWARQRH